MGEMSASIEQDRALERVTVVRYLGIQRKVSEKRVGKCRRLEVASARNRNDGQGGAEITNSHEPS